MEERVARNVYNGNSLSVAAPSKKGKLKSVEGPVGSRHSSASKFVLRRQPKRFRKNRNSSLA